MKAKNMDAKRFIFIIIAALYLATWVWGIPAVHTMIARDVISSYKAALEKFPSDVSERHPYVRFGASYAVLPCVIVNHYEYQYGGVMGWSGFTVDVWYGRGRATVLKFTKWIS